MYVREGRTLVLNEWKKLVCCPYLFGYENKVKANLEKRVESMGMQDKIFRVVVPEEVEVEMKNGKEKLMKRKVFPGYVLVELIMTDDSWYVVRNTPGVTGFVGSSGSI